MRRAMPAFFWFLCGSIQIGGLLSMAFYSRFSPLKITDIGFTLIFVPFFCAMVVGILLEDFDVEMLTGIMIAMALLAVVISFLFVYSPFLTGVVGNTTQLATSTEERQAMIFSSILLIPISIIGGIFGRGIGLIAFPSDRERALRLMLAKQTKEWHESMRKTQEEDEEIERNRQESEKVKES